MIKLFRTFAFIAILAITISSNSFSQVTFSGLMFGDYFYNVSNNDTTNWDGKNGFWIRRAYLTADYKSDDKLSGRLRFEMNSNGTLKANSTLVPFVKDAWIKYKTNLTGNDFFILGMQPTASFEYAEQAWGLREIEKTVDDLNKFRPARDFGLSYQGEASIFKWNVMYGNNTSTGSLVTDIPNNKRRVYASLQVKPVKELCVELYGDKDVLYSNPSSTATSPQTVSTDWHVLATYTTKEFRVGASYSGLVNTSRTFTNSAIQESLTTFNVLSAFAVYNVDSDWELFARYDMLNNPNTNGNNIDYVPISTSYTPSTIIAGASYSLNDKVKISPNLEYISYKDLTVNSITTSLKADIYARLTFFVKF